MGGGKGGEVEGWCIGTLALDWRVESDSISLPFVEG